MPRTMLGSHIESHAGMMYPLVIAWAENITT